MIFHFSIACSLATTYPTRKPAKPYAFENVRNKRRCHIFPVMLKYLENLELIQTQNMLHQ